VLSLVTNCILISPLSERPEAKSSLSAIIIIIIIIIIILIIITIMITIIIIVMTWKFPVLSSSIIIVLIGKEQSPRMGDSAGHVRL